MSSILKSSSTSSSKAKKPSIAAGESASSHPTFRVDIKFRNKLPAVPFDPKFLAVPFLESDYLYTFSHSSLERNYKYKIHMNPPVLGDDLIDVLGNEEWAKAVELDARDKSLMRREGDTAVATKTRKPAQRAAKSWLLKTYYTQENQYEVEEGDVPQEEEEEEDEDTEEDALFRRIGRIERQFQAARQMQQTGVVPGATRSVRRVMPFVPHRGLREVDLHLVRFKPGEQTGLENPDASAVLVRRKEKRSSTENPFSPLSLFVQNDPAKDDEDDLFAEEEETKDEQEVHFVRDYQVELHAQPGRFGVFVEQDRVRYVELHDESLKVFRMVKRVRRMDDEEDETAKEAHVKLHMRHALSVEEKAERAKRRAELEGDYDE